MDAGSRALPELAEGEKIVLLEAKGGIQKQGDVVMPSLPDDWRLSIRRNAITLGKRCGVILMVR